MKLFFAWLALVSLATAQVTITDPTPLPSSQVGHVFNYTLNATGGTGPYGWTIQSGNLPTGEKLTRSGVIYSTPTVAGTYNFTIKVQDNATFYLDDDDSTADWDTWTMANDNPGGTGIPTSTTTAVVTSPARDGTSLHMGFSTVQNFTNVLWSKKLAADNNAIGFTWDRWVYLASPLPSQLEQDIFRWDSSDLTNYMLSVQCNFFSGVWDNWHQNTTDWHATTLPCTLTADTWHHLVNYWQISGNNLILVGMTIDGVYTNMNLSNPAGHNLPVGWLDHLGMHFQLNNRTASSTVPKTVNGYLDRNILIVQDGSIASATKTFSQTAVNYTPSFVTKFSGGGVGSTKWFHNKTKSLQLSASNVVFASSTVGVAAPTQTLILSNNGEQPVKITSIGIRAGLTSADFGVTSDCPATVDVNLSFCTLALSFTPSAIGTRTAIVDVITDAPDSPDSANLSGLGLAASSPVVSLTTSLTFVDTLVGASGGPLTAVLQNTGNATLNIASITIAGTDSASFTKTTTCGATLAAAASCNINVTFSPGSSGNKVAEVDVVDDAPGTPHVTALAGTAVASNPLAIVVTSIPDAVQNLAYSAQLVANGGTPPYVFSLNSGSFPTGLSINSAGLISGTPSTVSGPFNPIVKVTDSALVTDTQSYTLSVLAAGSYLSVDGYCPNGTPAFGTSDHTAVLPLNCMNSDPSKTPSPNAPKTVTAGSYTSLANTIINAVCGDRIEVPAQLAGGAKAVYRGTRITPTQQCDATHWITIESDHMSSLPAYGTRVSPCYAGVASLPGRAAFNCPGGGAANLMPEFTSDGTNASQVLNLSGASYIRVQGMEITVDCSLTSVNYFKIIQGGAHQVYDRNWLHGCELPNAPSTSGAPLQIQDGISFDYSAQAAVDNYISDIYVTSNGASTDSQGINGGVGGALQTANKAVNNYIESSGECWIFGGGSATVVPTDIELRSNHCVKPLQWKCFMGTGTVNTSGTSVTWVSGNTFGTSVPGATWNGTRFVINGVNYNVSSVGSGTALTLTASAGTQSGVTYHIGCNGPYVAIKNGGEFKNGIRILWEGNITEQVWNGKDFGTAYNTVQSDQQGWAMLLTPKNQSPGLCPICEVRDVTMRYNLAKHTGNGLQVAAIPSDSGNNSQGIWHVSIHDNVFDDVNGSWFPQQPVGHCFDWHGQNGQTHTLTQGYVGHNTCLARGSTSNVPATPEPYLICSPAHSVQSAS